MKVINQKAHIDKDGMLKIDISTELEESDVELVVVISQVGSGQLSELSESDIQLIEDRWEEYKKNPANTLSWDEVKASIIKKNGL
jgi:hypothetical protein